MAIDVFAPAKINLTLHVTGRRADGYHLLDSLVAFAGVGDTVTAEAAEHLSLQIDGPMAAGLDAGDDNLVLRAARLLAPGGGAALRLTKRLPVASGIGGGSADAAATLRALARLWSLPETADDEGAHAWLQRRLGQVPVGGFALDTVVHTFSHYRFRMRPRFWRAVAPPAAVRDNDDLRWVSRSELRSLGIPAPIRTLVDAQLRALEQT